MLLLNIKAIPKPNIEDELFLNSAKDNFSSALSLLFLHIKRQQLI